MTKFILIRHAATDAAGKRLSGRMAGLHLNSEGRIQSERLAARLRSFSIAAIYSSPLERALETAGPLSGALNIACDTDEDFGEIEFGRWTDQSIDDLRNEPLFQRFNSFRSFTRIPGGELMLEAQLRIVRGLEKLCDRHPGQTIAIVSHSDVIKAAVAYYAGIHLDMFQRLEISPGSVSIIDIYEETARLLLLNDSGSLPI